MAKNQAPVVLGRQRKCFMQEHYTENFLQSTLSALGDKLKGCSLVVGGDDRYYGREATVKIIKMCAANGVRISTHTYS